MNRSQCHVFSLLEKVEDFQYSDSLSSLIKNFKVFEPFLFNQGPRHKKDFSKLCEDFCIENLSTLVSTQTRNYCRRILFTFKRRQRQWSFPTADELLARYDSLENENDPRSSYYITKKMKGKSFVTKFIAKSFSDFLFLFLFEKYRENFLLKHPTMSTEAVEHCEKSNLRC